MKNVKLFLKKAFEVAFDFMVIFAVRYLILFVSDLRNHEFKNPDTVWLVSIFIGLLFAEFFTITRKDK